MGRREIARRRCRNIAIVSQSRTARLKIVVICTTTVGRQDPSFPGFPGSAPRRSDLNHPPDVAVDLLRFKCPGGIPGPHVRAYKQERKYTRLLARGVRPFRQRVVVSFIHS